MGKKIKEISPFNFNEQGKTQTPEEFEKALVFTERKTFHLAIWYYFWKKDGGWYDEDTWNEDEGNPLLGSIEEIKGVTHWIRLTRPQSLFLVKPNPLKSRRYDHEQL